MCRNTSWGLVTNCILFSKYLALTQRTFFSTSPLQSGRQMDRFTLLMPRWEIADRYKSGRKPEVQLNANIPTKLKKQTAFVNILPFVIKTSCTPTMSISQFYLLQMAGVQNNYFTHTACIKQLLIVCFAVKNGEIILNVSPYNILSARKLEVLDVCLNHLPAVALM